jgi:hypothetical protein
MAEQRNHHHLLIKFSLKHNNRSHISKKVPTAAILVSVDVTSLYTNKPQEGIHTVCKAYVTSYKNETSYPYTTRSAT